MHSMNPTRLRRTKRALFAGCFLCAALAQAPAGARHPGLDLDTWSDDDLDAVLQAELDDDDLIACGIGNPNAPKTKEQMYRVIICALKDGGDDESEQEMDYDDLQAEMQEAGTTVEKVVWAAMDEADEMASGPQPGAAWVAALLHGGAAPAPEPADVEWLAQIRDGRIVPGRAAIGPTKGDLKAGVRGG
jgi:hypothetical protein